MGIFQKECYTLVTPQELPKVVEIANRNPKKILFVRRTKTCSQTIGLDLLAEGPYELGAVDDSLVIKGFDAIMKKPAMLRLNDGRVEFIDCLRHTWTLLGGGDGCFYSLYISNR